MLDPLFEKVADQTDIEAFTKRVQGELGLEQFYAYQQANGDIKLFMLAVPRGNRNEGIGSRAVEALCNYADRIGARIILTPGQKDPDWGTTSYNRLIRFYQRFGFVRNRGRHKDFTTRETMIRPARSRSMVRDDLTEDTSTYDPKVRYDHFNALLFDGSLPNIRVSMGSTRNKRVSGVTLAQVAKDPAKAALRRFRPNEGIRLIGLSVVISNRWQRSDEELDSTLVHEMIHVDLYTRGIFVDGEGQHGTEFRKRVREISQRWGQQVTMSDTIDDHVLAGPARRSVLNVFVEFREGQPYYFAPISSTAIPLVIKQQSGYSSRIGTTWGVYQISTPEWDVLAERLPVQRPSMPRRLKNVPGIEPRLSLGLYRAEKYSSQVEQLISQGRRVAGPEG